jgi:hypothetical protein
MKFAALALLTALLPLAHVTAAEPPEAEIKHAYKNLIDAENKHDLPAVRGMVWNSPAVLFVAKAPVGWRGYWVSTMSSGTFTTCTRGRFESIRFTKTRK